MHDYVRQCSLTFPDTKSRDINQWNNKREMMPDVVIIPRSNSLRIHDRWMMNYEAMWSSKTWLPCVCHIHSSGCGELGVYWWPVHPQHGLSNSVDIWIVSNQWAIGLFSLPSLSAARDLLADVGNDALAHTPFDKMLIFPRIGVAVHIVLSQWAYKARNKGATCGGFATHLQRSHSCLKHPFKNT
jgi:hypothetical protein